MSASSAPLSVRSCALSAGLCRWTTGLLLCALLVTTSLRTATAQTAPGSVGRNASSRLKGPPEAVATPPAAQSAPTGQPMYEFEAGPELAPGEVYYDQGGPLFDESLAGQWGPGGWEQGDWSEADGYPGAGYGRYGCPGIGCNGIHWHNFYYRADYLLWWGKGFAAPPLATTSDPGTPSSDAGVLGLPSTTVLFPTDNLAGASQSGGRARLGYWLDGCDLMAVEGTYFAIGRATSSFGASDFDYPILARPFVNVTPGELGHDAMLLAYPNVYSGSLAISGTSTMQGVEVIVRHLITRGHNWRIDWTLGWRYNRLDDSLSISSDRVTLGSPTAPTTGLTLTEWDRFSTRNTFNGVQLGLITETRHHRWWFETRTSLALGNNRAWVDIEGQGTATTPIPGAGVQTLTTPGGLLAQPTNIGHYQNDDFAIVPQLGLNLGFELAGGLWATVGYNFMYWSNVARPGDQIDMDVNLTQDGGGMLSGLARPEYTGFTTDYWAQGLNFGLAYRY